MEYNIVEVDGVFRVEDQDDVLEECETREDAEKAISTWREIDRENSIMDVATGLAIDHIVSQQHVSPEEARERLQEYLRD